MEPPLLLVSVKDSSDAEMNRFETTVVISYFSMRSDLGADGRTILKRILKNRIAGVWTGMIWYRTGKC
jgi:hypothetical protein